MPETPLSFTRHHLRNPLTPPTRGRRRSTPTRIIHARPSHRRRPRASLLATPSSAGDLTKGRTDLPDLVLGAEDNDYAVR